HGEEATLQRDDEDLVAVARREIAGLTGIQAHPVATRVSRWGGALPQYEVGHLERIRRIESAISAIPGLALAGAAYSGVGIPACIRTGQTAATRALSGLRQWADG
ncbi:MAG: FAD-dependent oxidoreductase, partial [Mycobacteriales bacterium]